MQSQAGDEYIHELASFIRANERGLAESGFTRRRPQEQQSLFSWFSPSRTNAVVLLKTDPHHLFYLLIRLEALRLPVGSLDIHVDSPSRPMSYPNVYPEQKNTDATSFSSFRSSFSAVSNFSLGGSWWSQNQLPDIDTELKYIYSSFTKLPALRIGPPGQKVVHELLHDPPDQNAVPLNAFKNLQHLECEDIDPRTLLGWDRLAESLRSLKIRNSGLQDISDIFISAVLDDEARSQDSGRSRHRSIPHTILEQPDDHEDDNPSVSNSPMSKLSPLKWAFLKHLFLPDNELTFFPPELIPYLKSLSHLDLSSNLLVSVPAGLGELYNLVSLNLTDNLIDSVLGIYQNLGQIFYLNLARNRLDSLCGLERLLALERIDLRNNLLEDSAEIGRLAVLPNVSELWVEGNLFVDTEERYRTKCFDYFWKEGKHITLDGTGPTLLERRNLSTEGSTSAPPFVSSSAPLISVEPLLVPPLSVSLSTSNSPQISPFSAPTVNPGRKKKHKRVVDLNGNTIAESISRSTSHSRTPTVESEAEPTGDETVRVEESTPSAPSSPVTPDVMTVDRLPRHSRHTRYQTEYTSSSKGGLAPPQHHQAPLSLLTGPATLSSRSEIRRARVTASMFEPPNSEGWKPFATVDDDAATYRQKIEVLKRDMGDNWLKVYNQSQPSP